MANKNTLILSLKIILMSTGFLFIAIIISLSLHPLLTSELIPTLLSTCKAWFRPPYLYVIINAIIVTIAASSRLHNQAPPKAVAPPPPHLHHHDVISVRHDPFPHYDDVSVTEIVNGAVGSYYGAVLVKDVEIDQVVRSTVPEREVVDQADHIESEREESTVIKSSTWTPPPLDASPEFLLSERPPASSRFGHHRRPAKASPIEGGKALRVTQPKRQETLESTWRAITEGRHIPLKRHLKKSDTWENQCRQINLLDDLSPSPSTVKKSETFKDRTNYSPPPVPSSRLKKDPSLSQDELNRRVEAFINKFNQDMRLQRQQSIQQFMEKINRAA